jgi:uncharacterized protein
MSSNKKSPRVSEAVARLCPQCAMCCNGVLFKDVELQPGDAGTKLLALGIPVRKQRVSKFPQPCAALQNCRCNIYKDRPVRCRQFECALLKAVVAGENDMVAASRVVRETQRRAEKVKRLLRELGDADESVALSLRFKRTKHRLESSQFDEATGDRFGELTLAVHDLNLLLREKFYPSPSD